MIKNGRLLSAKNGSGIAICASQSSITFVENIVVGASGYGFQWGVVAQYSSFIYATNVTSSYCAEAGFYSAVGSGIKATSSNSNNNRYGFYSNCTSHIICIGCSVSSNIDDFFPDFGTEGNGNSFIN